MTPDTRADYVLVVTEHQSLRLDATSGGERGILSALVEAGWRVGARISAFARCGGHLVELSLTVAAPRDLAQALGVAS